MDAPPLYVLGSRSQVGLLMQARDWSTSPLGAPATWPQSLRTCVELMLDSKFPMFLAWGPELGFIYNDAYSEVLGSKHPAALGSRFEQVWQEIWPELEPVVARALDGNASYYENLPLLMNRKGYDEQTWFTFSYSPVRDETGCVRGVYCACTETTGQVVSERNRAKENLRLKALFQQAPGYIAVLSEPTHVFELVNDAYLALVGVRDLVGKPIRQALPELEGQGFFELLDNVYASGETFVGRGLSAMLQRTDGAELEQRYVDFVFQPIHDDSGKVSGIFVEGADVTEAARASVAIRESEARMRQLANNIPHLAWMANPDGHIHWYNDRWYDYTGTSIESMAGWGWQSVHDPEALPQVMEGWKASLASGQPWEMTFPIRAASGEFRMFASRAVPLHDKAGNIVQWFGTNTDVTEVLNAQNNLKEASQRKDEFLAMLAHELRNPLAPISTAADLLRLSRLDEARVQHTARIISRQVTHMTKLVDDLLDVSRVTRGLVTLRADTVEVNQLVTEAIEQVQALVASKQHRLVVRTVPEPLHVRGDRTRLIQVFANLLNNAARYTHSGGVITIDLGIQQGQVVVSISDTGIGLSPRLIPHIFELFTQGERSADRAQGGLGLGLALVKSLVGLHDGTVSASSDGTGQGSCFTVRLPLVAAGARGGTDDPAAEGSNLTAAQQSLMVVDDNEDAAQMLSMLLETVGHKVWVSHHAHDALKLAQETTPAMLFLDIGLPDIDGYELAKRLRAMRETASSVLVAVTGYGQPEDREKALQAGFDHHLVKPVKLAAVLDLIERLNRQH